MVQPDSTRETTLCKESQLGDSELVELDRMEGKSFR